MRIKPHRQLPQVYDSPYMLDGELLEHPSAPFMVLFTTLKNGNSISWAAGHLSRE